MSDTMSMAEDQFEKMFVDDMVESSKMTKLESSLDMFVKRSSEKLGKEKNSSVKQAIEKQIFLANKKLEEERLKRKAFVRKEAISTFRGMTLEQKFDLAKRYADRGKNTYIVNSFIRELGRKADRQNLGELNRRTDAYFQRPDEHDIRRKIIDKINAKIAALQAKNEQANKTRVEHHPGDLQQSEVVEVDNSLDDYKKKRANVRDGNYRGRSIDDDA